METKNSKKVKIEVGKVKPCYIEKYKKELDKPGENCEESCDNCEDSCENSKESCDNCRCENEPCKRDLAKEIDECIEKCQKTPKIDDVNDKIDELVKVIEILEKNIIFGSFTAEEKEACLKNIEKYRSEIKSLEADKKVLVNENLRKMEKNNFVDNRETKEQKPYDDAFLENNKKVVEEYFNIKPHNERRVLTEITKSKNGKTFLLNVDKHNIELSDPETNILQLKVNIDFVKEIVNKILNV